ncbi:MAG: hypothetical protein PHW04_06565 [Candidatus Wallbacteria bacterium]|nr:hypothetical protein [Candidatus Wallbacteria bacterium]
MNKKQQPIKWKCLCGTVNEDREKCSACGTLHYAKFNIKPLFTIETIEFLRFSASEYAFFATLPFFLVFGFIFPLYGAYTFFVYLIAEILIAITGYFAGKQIINILLENPQQRHNSSEIGKKIGFSYGAVIGLITGTAIYPSICWGLAFFMFGSGPGLLIGMWLGRWLGGLLAQSYAEKIYSKSGKLIIKVSENYLSKLRDKSTETGFGFSTLKLSSSYSMIPLILTAVIQFLFSYLLFTIMSESNEFPISRQLLLCVPGLILLIIYPLEKLIMCRVGNTQIFFVPLIMLLWSLLVGLSCNSMLIFYNPARFFISFLISSSYGFVLFFYRLFKVSRIQNKSALYLSLIIRGMIFELANTLLGNVPMGSNLYYFITQYPAFNLITISHIIICGTLTGLATGLYLLPKIVLKSNA